MEDEPERTNETNEHGEKNTTKENGKEKPQLVVRVVRASHKL